MDQQFNLDRSQVDGQARVRFVGELDMASVKQARADMMEVLDMTASAVTVDLGGLTFCDASGVRLLLQLDAEIKARGRAMVLRNPTPFLHRVLGIAGVSELLTIEDGRGG